MQAEDRDGCCLTLRLQEGPRGLEGESGTCCPLGPLGCWSGGSSLTLCSRLEGAQPGQARTPRSPQEGSPPHSDSVCLGSSSKPPARPESFLEGVSGASDPGLCPQRTERALPHRPSTEVTTWWDWSATSTRSGLSTPGWLTDLAWSPASFECGVQGRDPGPLVPASLPLEALPTLGLSFPICSTVSRVRLLQLPPCCQSTLIGKGSYYLTVPECAGQVVGGRGWPPGTLLGPLTAKLSASAAPGEGEPSPQQKPVWALQAA